MSTQPRRSSYRAVSLLVAVAFVATCAVTGLSDPVDAGEPLGASETFSVTTDPAITPSFDASIPDYVVRCAGMPTTRVSITGDGPVKVAGTTFTGPVTLDLPLVPGQAVTIESGGDSYHIRCLPADFPSYSSDVPGEPHASGYLVTLVDYVIVFDPHGVPVWWYKDPSAPLFIIDAKFLDAQTIAWAKAGLGEYVLHGLDGAQTSVLGGAEVPLDFHELQRLPNGNYLAIIYVDRNCPADPTQCIDLSSWGLSSQETVTDNVIVEVNAASEIVWSWSAADNLDIAEENISWRNRFPDVIHMNSVESDGNGGILFSSRHLDAVHRIDTATGDVTWKVGGSPTDESLTVIGDQYPNTFDGQHDARVTTDGTLTVHDNGTLANRPARALEFSLDTTAGTATVLEEITDPRSTPANCCGGSTKLSTGNWVVSWGANDYMTELDSQGVPQLTIGYPGTFSYRAAAVSASIASLRQGMDAMVAPLVNPPVTSVVLPNEGQVLSGVEPLVALAWNMPDLTNVEFRVTGNGWNDAVVATAQKTIFGWIGTWDTTLVTNGSYSLQSVAYNSDGTNIRSPALTITVDN